MLSKAYTTASDVFSLIGMYPVLHDIHHIPHQSISEPKSNQLDSIPNHINVFQGLNSLMYSSTLSNANTDHGLACLVAFLTLVVCLAASGAWKTDIQKSNRLTRVAYWLTFFSHFMTVIEVRPHHSVNHIGPGEPEPTYIPSPAHIINPRRDTRLDLCWIND